MENLIPTAGPGLRKARTTRYRATLALAPLVLVGDGDRGFRRTVSALLRRKGYRVRTHQSPLGLLEDLSESRGDMDAPEFLVLGVTSPERDALEVLGAMDMAHGVPPAIVVVPDGAPELRESATSHGAALVVSRFRAFEVLAATVADVAQAEWAAGD